jgi:peptidoglycan/LPS O-acetylase OafA/YrhL
MLKFNIVTGIVARDGGEILAALYLGFVYFRWLAIRWAVPAMVLSVMAAIIVHNTISNFDENFRPAELGVSLLVPAAILVWCFRHLPTEEAEARRKLAIKRWGAAAVGFWVAFEVLEAFVSTLAQDTTEIRNGVISGAVILLGIVLTAHIALRLWWKHTEQPGKPSFKVVIDRQMENAMAMLNLIVGLLGLAILYNAHEPLNEYGAGRLLLPLMGLYLVFFLLLGSRTSMLLRAHQHDKKQIPR